MINSNAPIRGIPTAYSEGINPNTDCQGECGGSCSCSKKG